ncbi:hypothetical protein QTI05_22645 [Variovorax sp. J22R193]|uniref:FaeA/PapI family transcriptional regulator n=1 Tax=Variovorax fucosicus TaxID=3053517 RepID=UPI002577E409|nr:FaeA/PapI family transcriptional regulator [Variovorax sp. J22R193]MDM0041857.1 hypothetical protein [Variovorax sp. J22R193]
MSAAKKIIALLSDGVSRTNPEIAKALGCTQQEAREILAHLKYRGKVESAPVRYSLAVDGVDRTIGRRKRLKADRPEKPATPKVPEAMKTDCLIGDALRSRPALQSAWGAMA